MFSVLIPYFTRVNIQYEEELFKTRLTEDKLLPWPNLCSGNDNFEMFWAPDSKFHEWLKGAEKCRQIVAQTVDKQYS